MSKSVWLVVVEREHRPLFDSVRHYNQELDRNWNFADARDAQAFQQMLEENDVVTKQFLNLLDSLQFRRLVFAILESSHQDDYDSRLSKLFSDSPIVLTDENIQKILEAQFLDNEDACFSFFSDNTEMTDWMNVHKGETVDLILM